MKRALPISALLLIAGLLSATAQVLSPVGQIPGGAINQNVLNNNSDSAGFNPGSLTPSLAVPSTSTAQATFGSGVVLTGTVITTQTTVITTCSSSTGVTLPAIERYTAIVLINRSGGSCLIWPSIGATVETALGTNGSTNAPFTMLTNTDVTFRPINATTWYQ